MKDLKFGAVLFVLGTIHGGCETDSSDNADPGKTSRVSSSASGGTVGSVAPVSAGGFERHRNRWDIGQRQAGLTGREPAGFARSCGGASATEPNAGAGTYDATESSQATGGNDAPGVGSAAATGGLDSVSAGGGSGARAGSETAPPPAANAGRPGAGPSGDPGNGGAAGSGGDHSTAGAAGSWERDDCFDQPQKGECENEFLHKPDYCVYDTSVCLCTYTGIPTYTALDLTTWVCYERNVHGCPATQPAGVCASATPEEAALRCVYGTQTCKCDTQRTAPARGLWYCAERVSCPDQAPNTDDLCTRADKDSEYNTCEYGSKRCECVLSNEVSGLWKCWDID